MDQFELEDAILARLEGVLPRGTPLLRIGEHPNFSEADSPRHAVKVAFERLSSPSQVIPTTRQFAEFAVTVFWDADVSSRDAARALFNLAIKKLAGWAPVPGRECRLIDGPPAQDEGGVVGVSFAITIPVFLTAT